ncbi:type II secretion system GspH family protein [Bradyrhizobium sp. ISRA432]|nr:MULTISPECIES: type II secretion system protein [unclassified Bradyrhizobium]WGR75105.1 type II secretion system GspH family protein [Bradyrhizobium sp. ISRA426]WGR82611.1 type II secretion system GspH family protein [Bradyrhizobium sp. ISRA430]WGR90305.1 type II secretion system GspH family protein [Bradyrhizobium sp. ISRA432]
MVEEGEAGFTLIEVLIALAVVSLSLAAIGAVVASNMRAVRKIEEKVTLIEDANASLVTAIPDRSRLVPGAASGESASGRWIMRVAPLGSGWDLAAGQAGWIPELVELRVRSASGASVDVRTVRLARTAR